MASSPVDHEGPAPIARTASNGDQASARKEPEPAPVAAPTQKPSRGWAIKRWALTAAWVAAISAATSATVQTLLLIRAVQPVVNAAKSVEISAQSAARGVNTIETAIVSSKFVISSLRDGDTVTIDELVRGLTPFPGRMHYVVVTPVKAGDSYVQEEANVASDGTWTGHARFGSGDVGLNEKFIVRCVATREALHPGSSLASQPAGADAVFSSPITVLRTR